MAFPSRGLGQCWWGCDRDHFYNCWVYKKTWGPATYPVLYTYDSYDRLTSMSTYRGGSGWTGGSWPGSPGTPDTTTWAYHEGSGMLTSKEDAASKSVSYTYATGGRLDTRTWARADGTNSLVTTYRYNDAGDLTEINYSDSTPDVTFTVDRLGRQKTAASDVSSHAFAYDGLLLDTESIVRAGVSNTITRSYDAYGRPTGFTMGDYSVTYGYDALGRFYSVSSSVFSAISAVNYSYLSGSDLLSGYTLGDLAVTRAYEDHRNLLTQVKNAVDTNTVSQYNYANDNGSRRTSVKHSGSAFDAGAAFNKYGYNMRSEVTNANRYWGTDLGDTGDPVDGQAFGYAYDNIGNRTTASRGDEEATYTANNLNQYSQRTVSDLIDVLGSASTSTTVTVNNQATTRHEKYWYKDLTVTNDSAAVWQGISVVGVYNPPGTTDPDIVTTETGAVFVAQTPEAFSYDDDGNLTSDGRFAYSWDAENRLIAVETLTNLSASVPRVKVEFTYDYMSRRAGKSVSAWDGSNWVGQATNLFVYDGWNCIRESRSGAPAACTNWYAWGLDLSGSLSGAGGIGGLLSAQLGTNSVVYCYDANGNVSELLDSTGSVAAHYEYSPFGETIVATGPLAEDNPYRFSTKFTDDETGLVYYGYRFYDPVTGRWLSRDPIGEKMGLFRLYGDIFRKLKQQNANISKDAIDIVFGPTPSRYTVFLEQNEYRYCRNNPLEYYDDDGAVLGPIMTVLVWGMIGVMVYDAVILPFLQKEPGKEGELHEPEPIGEQPGPAQQPRRNRWCEGRK